MRTTPCPRCGAALPPGASADACPRCLLALGRRDPAASADGGRPAPAPDELAAAFPQLEILEVLGRGGMGVVYRARQRGLDRLVALKLLFVDEREREAFAERFAREARALASLSHPGIVAVHDFGRAGEHYYLLMEHVDGANLRQMLQAGLIGPHQALEIVVQVCEALQYAHDEGVVHRDIKPENVLIDRRGRVKIADFGLAKLVRGPASALTRSDQAMGTPHYMAPEQVERPLEVDHRADIYSLGVVFYELLTGELPLGRFEPPSRRVDVDVRLDEVVLRTLEKEPELRYQHASDVGTRVRGIASSPAAAAAADAGPVASVPAGHPIGHREHGLRALLGCGCLALLGLVALAVLSALFLAGTDVSPAPGAAPRAPAPPAEHPAPQPDRGEL